jgi:hypothetical protein
MVSGRATALVETALLATGVGLLLFVSPHALTGDDNSRFASIENLLHNGELDESRYSLIGPLLSVPALLLGEVVRTPQWWAERVNVLAVGIALALAYLLLRDRVDRRLLRRFFLILLFASMLTERFSGFNAEGLTVGLVGLGIALIATGRPVPGWAAVVLAAANTPAAVPALVLVCLAVAATEKRLRYLLPPLAALFLVLGEAWLRRGGPFVTGYEDDHGYRTVLPYSGRSGFSYPFLLGVLSMVFSFGRGIAFYAPGLWLGLSSRTRELAQPSARVVQALALALGGLVAVYASWWAWYGGYGWGPRFLVLAALPASWLIALRLRRPAGSIPADLLTLVVLLASTWVSISGVLFQGSEIELCGRNHFALESLCWYVPEFSTLWRPLVEMPSEGASQIAMASFCALVAVYLAQPAALSVSRAARAGFSRRLRTMRRGAWRF